MTAADLLPIAHKHGLTARDDPDRLGVCWVRCPTHPRWDCDVVAEKYAREPFGCAFCLGELSAQ